MKTLPSQASRVSFYLSLTRYNDILENPRIFSMAMINKWFLLSLWLRQLFSLNVSFLFFTFYSKTTKGMFGYWVNNLIKLLFPKNLSHENLFTNLTVKFVIGPLSIGHYKCFPSWGPSWEGLHVATLVCCLG